MASSKSAARLQDAETQVAAVTRTVETALERLIQSLSVHAEALLRIEHLETEIAQGLHPRRNRGVEQSLQNLLSLQYRELVAAGRPLPSFGDAEARFYSQNGEDGIIQLLLAVVGTDTKRAVEICAGNGIENNSANLIVNHGWTALLVDGSAEIIEVGSRFYEVNSDTWYAPPTLRQAWITRDSVNAIVEEAGFAGPIDLLTVDVDGNDYWIWDALDCVDPRIVVVEYNPWWPADAAKTVPYADDFVWEKGTQYVGASLGAMVKLGRAKGYRLVGVNRYGFNAFFVRDDLAPDVLAEVDPQSLPVHPVIAAGRASQDIEQHTWVDV